eukprot:11049797-Ditylum_brightwellii.AAC.1
MQFMGRYSGALALPNLEPGRITPRFKHYRVKKSEEDRFSKESKQYHDQSDRKDSLSESEKRLFVVSKKIHPKALLRAIFMDNR